MKAGQQYSDQEIIAKIVAGETAQFELLIRRYNADIYRVGRSYNFSHDETQDLMQEALINAYINLKKFENRASFKTWLIRIMANGCYQKKQLLSFKNEVKSNINETAIPIYTSRNATDTSKVIMNRELSNVIESALAKVPEDYRVVFTLREINGLNVNETAEVLDITEGNVKVRLNRAKTMLRREIEKSYSKEQIYEFNLVYCDAMVAEVMKKIQKLDE